MRVNLFPPEDWNKSRESVTNQNCAISSFLEEHCLGLCECIDGLRIRRSPFMENFLKMSLEISRINVWLKTPWCRSFQVWVQVALSFMLRTCWSFSMEKIWYGKEMRGSRTGLGHELLIQVDVQMCKDQLSWRSHLVKHYIKQGQELRFAPPQLCPLPPNIQTSHLSSKHMFCH